MPAKKTYPYKFLDAYTKEDAEFFFGRDDEINALYEMLFQSDLIVVYGASGTGKTSLIQCGLGNRFQPHDWLPLSVRRLGNINAALEKSLQEASGIQDGMPDFLLSGDEFYSDGKAVSISKFQNLLRSVYFNSFKPVYLIFDQFEEIFILGSKEEQDKFYKSVQEIVLAKQPVKLLFSIREEYLGYLFDFEKIIPNLLHKKLRVEPMDITGVRKVVTGTTDKNNSLVNLKEGEEIKIADGIFNKIRENEKTRTIQLPYLQVFVDKLYLQKTADNTRETEALLSIDDINATGNIGDILRDFLEDRIVDIKAEYKLPDDKLIWEVLSSFVTLEGTKEPLTKDELNEKLSPQNNETTNLIVDGLFKNKILRYSNDENTYEIAHDSLAKRIAERRSDEEIALLEVKRLIKNQVSLNPELRVYFSANQLQLIRINSSKLKVTAEESDWIKKSERNLVKKRNRKRITFLSILGLVVLALIVMTLFFISTNRRKNEIQKADKLSKAKDLLDFGDNYIFLGKKDFACDSYQKGLDSLKDYVDDTLYKTIKHKLDSLGCSTK